MAETPSNDRVSTRDLILGLHGKVDGLDERMRAVELQLAREAGENDASVRQARKRLDTTTMRLAVYAFVVQVPAAIVYTLGLAHAGKL